MPIKRKKTGLRKFILWTLLGILLVLMVISFAPVQHLTEIVVYP